MGRIDLTRHDESLTSMLMMSAFLTAAAFLIIIIGYTYILGLQTIAAMLAFTELVYWSCDLVAFKGRWSRYEKVVIEKLMAWGISTPVALAAVMIYNNQAVFANTVMVVLVPVVGYAGMAFIGAYAFYKFNALKYPAVRGGRPRNLKK